MAGTEWAPLLAKSVKLVRLEKSWEVRKYPGKRSPDAIDLSGITKREFVGPKFES